VPSPRSSTGWRLAVVLVLDLADDLLEDVLDGDQPGGAAVLVDDDRDVAERRPASRAAARRPACSRDEHRLAHGLVDPRGAAVVLALLADEVLEVGDAEDVVGVVARRPGCG
jgi:hypothetical protein